MMHRRGYWLCAALTVLACGCGNRDVNALGKVCHRTVGKLEGVAGGPRGNLADGWHLLRGSFSDATPASRVLLRLHWDKALADADVQAEATGPGVVRLTGTVADEGQRARAGELAQSTQGVEQVVNELIIAGQ